MGESNTRLMRLAVFTLVVALLAAVIVAGQTPPPGTSGTTPAYSTPFTQGFCGGVITTSPVVGGASSTTGTNDVIITTIMIMLGVLAVLAVVYMLSFVINNVGNLQNMVKTELVETIGTAIILVMFFGGFLSIGTLITSGNGQSFAGPGRSIFLNDCEQVTTTSIGLIPPLLTVGTEDWLLTLVTSIQITLKPDGFGIESTPLIGLSYYGTTLTILQGFTTGLILLTLAIAFFLGFIYALFPIFLYLGIVLRAFPWSRAAGGTLIAVFLGFYIFFPLILYTTMSGFANATLFNTNIYAGCNTGTPSLIEGTITGDSTLGSSNLEASTWLTYWPEALLNVLGLGNSSSCGYGLINGYIHYFIEPPGVALFVLILAFIVSFDFADLLADLLGAPSLTGSNLSSFLRRWV